jgi:hypothetical protein
MEFDPDPLVNALTAALLMTFGVAPGSHLPRESEPMNPIDWLPYAKEIAEELRGDGLRDEWPR